MIISISSDLAKSNFMRVVIREGAVKMRHQRLILKNASKHLFMPGVVAVVSNVLYKLYIYAGYVDTDTDTYTLL